MHLVFARSFHVGLSFFCQTINSTWHDLDFFLFWSLVSLLFLLYEIYKYYFKTLCAYGWTQKICSTNRHNRYLLLHVHSEFDSISSFPWGSLSPLFFYTRLVRSSAPAKTPRIKIPTRSIAVVLSFTNPPCLFPLSVVYV